MIQTASASQALKSKNVLQKYFFTSFYKVFFSRASQKTNFPSFKRHFLVHKNRWVTRTAHRDIWACWSHYCCALWHRTHSCLPLALWISYVRWVAARARNRALGPSCRFVPEKTWLENGIWEIIRRPHKMDEFIGGCLRSRVWEWCVHFRRRSWFSRVYIILVYVAPWISLVWSSFFLEPMTETQFLANFATEQTTERHSTWWSDERMEAPKHIPLQKIWCCLYDAVVILFCVVVTALCFLPWLLTIAISGLSIGPVTTYHPSLGSWT